MTRKQLDTMREFRLMTWQIVIPAIIIGAAILTHPKVRRRIHEVKDHIEAKYTVWKWNRNIKKAYK